MKPARTFGPLWLWPATLAIVAWLLRAGWDSHLENRALRAAAFPQSAAGIASKRDEPPLPPSLPPATGGPPPAAPRLEDLRTETRREIAARESVEAKIAALEKRLPAHEGEVLVSFGRVEQMGQRAARAILLMTKLASGLEKSEVKPASELGPGAESAITDLLGQLGEVRALENEPAEIARFQAAALREVFGFDAATASRAATVLEAEFASLKTQQLTAPFRPTENSAEWDHRRDAAMTVLAARVSPLLPADHEQLPLLPGILNLGGGTRTEVKIGPDGHGTTTMSLPLLNLPNSRGL